MIRPKLAIVATAFMLTGSLAGCSSVMDVFGPKANRQLVTLAHQAEADAASLHDDSSAQELRTVQASQLFDEITRLCGVDENGHPPASCEVSTENDRAGASSISDAARQSVTYLIDNRKALPEDSVDLVVAQSIDLVAAAGLPLPEGGAAEPDTADHAAAKDMLSREYAMQYGLGLASAFADEGLQARIDTLAEASMQRSTSLEEFVGADAASASAMGYEFQSGQSPQTTEEAGALVDTLSSDMTTAWRAAAGHAESDEWLEKAIYLAANSQSVGG
ncbi:hypothetical protein ACXZ66_08745 [Corynebacterium sp. S7]